MGRKRDQGDEALAELERDKARYEADPRIRQLVTAARKGNAQRVAELLKAGADPNAREVTDVSIDTPVAAAVESMNPEVFRLLAEAGADLNAGFPTTPLELAIAWGKKDVIRVLIAGGVDVNHPSPGGRDTPLDEAIDKGDPEIVAMLLDAGADPHLVSPGAKVRRAGRSPAQSAVNNKDVLAVFLERNALGPNPTPLLLCGAVTRGDLTEVKRLVEGGADVNARGPQGELPLVNAAMMGNLKIIKFLLSRGADANAESGRKDAYDSTPLVAAVASGKLAAVQAIVDGGGTRHVDEALDYAKACRLKKITDYLLELRAKLGPSKKPAKPKKLPTGVPTFDVNDACLLVEGAVDAVAPALRDHLDAKTYQPDALGQTVKLGGNSFAVFRLAGQPWSIVMRLSGRNPYEYLKTAAARALSEKLKTRAILVSSGDTGGVYQYVTFDKGQCVELFDTGSADYGNGADRAALTPKFRKAYDVDLGAFDDVAIGNGNVFASTLRKPTLAGVKNPLTFIEDHLKRENAFVPFFGPDDEDRPGRKRELTIEGFGSDDIERLDYVAVK